MAKLLIKTVNVTSNPSGAAAAARQGNVIMIVDVIDMSTTAEAALEVGAIDILGASPDQNIVPVSVNPEKIGYIAGKKAQKYDTGVVVAAEPKICKEEYQQRRLEGIQQVIKGIERAGANLIEVVPNLGKEIFELVDLKDRVLVIVSPAGGAAFDAAYNYGAPVVITGTIARTANSSGVEPARRAAKRAIEEAAKFRCGITVVASSSNSLEDVLAANYISSEILNTGFLQLDFTAE